MKITLLCIGKTDESYLNTGIDKYLQRLKHYINFSMTIIPDIKNTKHLSPDQQKAKEAEQISKQLNATDMIVIVDEKGMALRLMDFAKYLERHMLNGTQHLVLIIGGTYRFGNSL